MGMGERTRGLSAAAASAVEKEKVSAWE